MTIFGQVCEIVGQPAGAISFPLPWALGWNSSRQAWQLQASLPADPRHGSTTLSYSPSLYDQCGGSLRAAVFSTSAFTRVLGINLNSLVCTARAFPC